MTEEYKEPIRLKTLSMYFNGQRYGNKNFEIRKNDRPFYIGGLIELVEIDQPAPLKALEETGRKKLLEVTYMLFNFQGIEEGYVILGTKPANV